MNDERLKLVTIEKRHTSFDLLPDERPYAEWLAHEIEASFGYEPLPPEVGTVLLPDLVTPKLPGEVRLYDCLFSTDEWVKPTQADEPAPGARVNASHLTEPFLGVLTVLSAIFHIVFSLRQRTQGRAYCVVSTDGVLRKEELHQTLAWIRSLLLSPDTHGSLEVQGKLEAATRELEALTAAWDGNGAPPDAIVAWASSFLASWDVGEKEEGRGD